jgi:hypothetical protein
LRSATPTVRRALEPTCILRFRAYILDIRIDRPVAKLIRLLSHPAPEVEYSLEQLSAEDAENDEKEEQKEEHINELAERFDE